MLYFHSVDYRAPQRNLVGVLELFADRNAAGDSGNGYVVWLQLTTDEEACGLAIGSGTECHNYFLNLSSGYALDQLLNGQVARGNAIHRRDDAAQHMVEPVILPCVLIGPYDLHILHYSDDGLVAIGVGADVTHIVVRDVVAHAAVLYFLAETTYAVRKS